VVFFHIQNKSSPWKVSGSFNNDTLELGAHVPTTRVPTAVMFITLLTVRVRAKESTVTRLAALSHMAGLALLPLAIAAALAGIAAIVNRGVVARSLLTDDG